MHILRSLGEITFTGVTRKNLVDHYKTNIQFYSSTNVKALEEFIYDVIPSVAPYNDSRYRFTHSLSNMAEQTTNTKGLLVAKRMSQVRNNGISVLPLVEVYYYDKYNRIIQKVSRNYQGYFERISNVYNFAGQVIQTRTQQFFSSTSYYIMDTFFKYDHRGRLIQTEYQVDGNSGNLYPRTVASAMVYNEAGQLKTRYLYSYSNQPFLQKTDYQYNIRGWLTRINDPNLSAPENDLFGMILYYNRKSNGSNGYWNGNIAEERWACGGLFNQGSSYSYDGVNRIKNSYFLSGTHTNSLGTTYSYDKNGNIKTLTRWSNAGTSYVDNITYGYKGNNSNRLDYTDDPSGDASGHFDFPGTLTGVNHYQYDLNGNMTRDDYRSYNISYNSFNLPSEVDFGSNKKTSYYYDGSGKKLTMIHAPGTYYPTNTEYRGQMVHQSCNGTSSLKYIITPEGRLLNKGTDASPVWEWNFDLADHLGNVRVVFRRSSTGSPERLSHTNYLPFGMKMPSPYSSGSASNYLYNGKELQADGSLEWYDYGARFYDAAIGRWHSVDPSGEQRFSFSSYNFCSNNPIIRIDSDGALDDIVITGENNSSVTIVTDLIDVEVDASPLGIDFGGNYSLEGEDIVSAGLDVVGVIDPSGVADGLNAGLQAKNGEWLGVLISGVGIVPYVGDIAKVGKIGKDVKIINKAIDAVTNGGKKIDPRSGKVLGPSGKPAVHTINKSTKKEAKDAARNDRSNSAKGRAVKHTKDKKGGRHYHNGIGPKGKGKGTKDYGDDAGKIDNNVHYEYPE